LARKELREVLRDRRTILTLVLMPILLYLLLYIAFWYFFRSGMGTVSIPQYRLGVPTQATGQRLKDLLDSGEESWRSANVIAPRRGEELAAHPEITYWLSEDPEAAVRAHEIHLAVKVRREKPLEFEAVYDPDWQTSKEALAHVEERLTAANIGFQEKHLVEAGEREHAWHMVLRATPLEKEERKGLLLAALIPLILILMTMTGAVYPAIDLTAGERERGTLEMLMATPVPRLGLLFAKYIAVLAVALLTALVNLGMMTITVYFSGLAPLLMPSGSIQIETLLAVFGLMLLFALFFSAVLLIVTSFARSFKEAQAYIVPLVLLSLLPGLLALLPGLELKSGLAAVPLLNIVLLARDLLEAQGDWLDGVVVVGSTTVYAVGALALAARIFGAEGVLFGEGGASSAWFRRKSVPRA
jgi:ABC-2 type transport system permease protein/sodium transport system permease protein